MLGLIYQKHVYKLALEGCVYRARVFELPARTKLVHITDYEHRHLFRKVADIVPDHGNGVRDIKPIPMNKNEFDLEREWVYLILVQGYIVKIGGTRTGMSRRWNSYACGQYCTERGNSGKCSETNANVFNTLCAFILQRGWRVELYGMPLERVIHTLSVLDQEVKAPVQTYHIYESKFLGRFESKYKCMPYLSSNSNPNYRD